jgi:hypothetical protein
LSSVSTHSLLHNIFISKIFGDAIMVITINIICDMRASINLISVNNVDTVLFDILCVQHSLTIDKNVSHR